MAADTFFYIALFFTFALGAVIGSFLNVVIHRVPAGASIIRPRSRCPNCEEPIRWYDNIPVVSWFLLEGTCRSCDESISARYPIIEALMGFLSAALWVKVTGPHFGLTSEAGANQLAAGSGLEAVPLGSLGLAFGFYLVFLALLVVIAFVDFDHYLIPHEFTLPGIVLGILAVVTLNTEAIMAPGSLAGFWPAVDLSSSLIGLVAGGLSVVILFYAYLAARGVEGLGGGDATLMALVGTWLGWPALLFVFFAASIQGLVAAALGKLFGAGFLKDSREILYPEDDLSQSETEDAPEAPGRRGRRRAEDDDAPQIDAETDDTSAVDAAVDDDDHTAGTDDETDDGDDGDDDAAGDDSETPDGGLALPFGPFIALSAAQFFFLGEFLPTWLSLEYLYY